MVDPAPPKVFISYSWSSETHMTWVEELAKRLTSDGVMVVFDQWDLERGQDKYVFMERMVTDPTVQKVLAICDEMYAAKADGREGGVGTESQIISREVYEKVNQTKFIPLVREMDSSGQPYLPTFFKNRIYLAFVDDAKFEDSYDELLRDIYNAPAKARPPLGSKPAHLSSAPPMTVRTAGAFLRYKNAIEQGRSHAPVLLTAYFDAFIESMPEFRIARNQDNAATFDELVLASLDQLRPYRDNFVECISFALRYAPGEHLEQAVVDFLEQLIPFQYAPDNDTAFSKVDFDNYRFFCWDLFLHLITVCIKRKQYGSAALFMESTYHVANPRAGNGHYENSMVEFDQTVPSFEQIRRQRLKLNLISVMAAILKERTSSGPIKFVDLVETDCILFIRGFTPITKSYGVWHPRCLPYAEYSNAAELFARASSDRGFAALQSLLKVRDRVGLMEALDNASTYGNQHFSFHAKFVLEHYLNYSELNRMSGRRVEGP